MRLPRKEFLRNFWSRSSSELRAEVVYKERHQILFLGEANFSFAAAVQKSFCDATSGGITATGYESKEELLKRFQIKRRLRDLERDCNVFYSVPVATAGRRFRANSFDSVVFNFPLAPKMEQLEHAKVMQEMYQDLGQLITDYLEAAALLLKAGGEAHLRLTDQHCTALAPLRCPSGLELERRLDFGEAFEKVYQPLGYRPTMVGSEGSFRVRHASTWLFTKRSSSTSLFRSGATEEKTLAIVSGILAGLALAGFNLQVKNEEELLQIATNIEGHPDNVAPCIYGGFQLGIHNGYRWWTDRVDMPHGLMCVVFCPDHATETSEARQVLKKEIALQDAIFNCGRVAVLVAAFATGNMEWLRHGTEDALHQQQRAPIHPHLKPLIKAALEAGAHGACLSGAGPAVIAFTSGRCGDVIAQNASEREEFNVAEALLAAADEIQCPGHVLITKPVEHGGYIVSETQVMDPENRRSRIHYVQD